MEDDEMEMSAEEYRRWVRATVQKNELISTDVQEKCDLLQSVLERRQKQAAMLLNLSKSVAACEAVVKRQYSLLGWEYRDTDTDDDDDDDDDDNTNCGISTPSRCEVVTGSTAANTLTLQNKGNLSEDTDKIKSLCLKRKAVVVLNRLPISENSSLHTPTPQNHHIKEEPFSGLDSTTQWTPVPSNDWEYSSSGCKPPSEKRRKVTPKDKKLAERDMATQPSMKSEAENNTMKTSALKTKGSTEKRKSDVTEASEPRASRSHEIRVDMDVIARHKIMSWKMGKVIEIVKKNGRLKYKVSFETRRKSLVSGHHIAFESTPHMQDLFVGARVVVRRGADGSLFCPGIVAEVPCKNNRMRFLIFFDDHTARYVQTISLRLVCEPLADPCRDILNDTHKKFMEKYLKAWPNPPQTQYKVGETIQAELNGLKQMCEVLAVDCSLIQVVFQEHQLKEWIYNGSISLGTQD